MLVRSLSRAVIVFFHHLIRYIRPSFLSPPVVVTQVRGHIAASFPPLPTTVRALDVSSREDVNPCFPRRLASSYYPAGRHG